MIVWMKEEQQGFNKHAWRGSENTDDIVFKRNHRLFTHFINYRTETEHGKYRFHWNKDKTW